MRTYFLGFVLVLALNTPHSFAVEECKEGLGNGPHKHVYVDGTYDRADAKPEETIAKWRSILDSTEPDEVKVPLVAALVNGLFSKETYPGHEVYRDAVIYLGNHSSILRLAVTVHLPGGLNGNSDPFWATVKAVTKETCPCGNERVIVPGSPMIADKWIPQEEPKDIVIKLGETIYIRPIGAHESAALASFKIDIEEGRSYVEPMMTPLGPITLNAFMSIFSRQVYFLDNLEPALKDGPLPMGLKSDNIHMVFVQFVRVDLKNNTLTIQLAKGAEIFTPTPRPEEQKPEQPQPQPQADASPSNAQASGFKRFWDNLFSFWR